MVLTGRHLVEAAFKKCIESVIPRKRVSQIISTSANEIRINSSIEIEKESKIVIIGFGKAVIEMARGAIDALGSATPAYLIAPKQFEASDVKIGNSTIFYGATNNLPDAAAIQATHRVCAEIERHDSPQTVFLFLISGGGSALLCSPTRNCSLMDKLATIRKLTENGATIQELNIIRQRLSNVKGGKLLNKIKHGKCVSLIISDIVGNPIDLISSGPTVPNSLDFDCLELLRKLKIDKNELPISVQNILSEKRLNAPTVTDTNRVMNLIISSNETALSSIANFFKTEKTVKNAQIISSNLSGNATKIGEKMAKLINSRNDAEILQNLAEIIEKPVSVSNFDYPLALIFGGETTVILKGRGKGGRNQEMVLSCLQTLQSAQNSPSHLFTFLSAGTDGQDGPTDAAGAIITDSDVEIIDPSPSKYLDNSDSYNFWTKFNNGSNHLKIGSTGTNVMDIQILILDKKSINT